MLCFDEVADYGLSSAADERSASDFFLCITEIRRGLAEPAIATT